jgi:hypothetical protein
MANFAGYIDIGEKIHLDLNRAVALAVLAAATLHVEAEASRFPTAGLRFGETREELAYRCEDADIGGRI